MSLVRLHFLSINFDPIIPPSVSRPVAVCYKSTIFSLTGPLQSENDQRTAPKKSPNARNGTAHIPLSPTGVAFFSGLFTVNYATTMSGTPLD